MESDSAWQVAAAVAPSVGWAGLQAGVLTGISGAAVGGATGLFRSKTPGLFATASGIQCFVLGSTYWATRQSVLIAQAYQNQTPLQELTSSQRKSASAIGGGISGITSAVLFRTRSNVIPAAIVFSGLGYTGQMAYEYFNNRHDQLQQQPQSDALWLRFAKSRWSPLKVLSDDEYEQMLTEKLIRVEAEIALIDEDVERLRNTQNRPSSNE